MLRNFLPSLCVNLKQQSYQKATSCALHSCLLQENPDYTPLVTSALVFLMVGGTHVGFTLQI